MLVTWIQFGHLGFLNYRVYDCFHWGMPRSFLLFQIMWNVLFAVSILGQIVWEVGIQKIKPFIFEISFLCPLGCMRKQPKKRRVKPHWPNLWGWFLHQLLYISFPHVFLYNRTPASPQYMVLLLLEALNINGIDGAIFVTPFGCIELTLVEYNWESRFLSLISRDAVARLKLLYSEKRNNSNVYFTNERPVYENLLS